jgi:hypothetical protein
LLTTTPKVGQCTNHTSFCFCILVQHAAHKAEARYKNDHIIVMVLILYYNKTIEHVKTLLYGTTYLVSVCFNVIIGGISHFAILYYNMEIYGWIAPGSLPQIRKSPGGFCSVVMEFFSALLTTYDDDLRIELRSSVGNKVPALGTNDESNITLISASSIAAQNEYITNAVAGYAIDEKQVNNQNNNDNELLISKELDMCQQNKYINNTGLNF